MACHPWGNQPPAEVGGGVVSCRCLETCGLPGASGSSAAGREPSSIPVGAGGIRGHFTCLGSWIQLSTMAPWEPGRKNPEPHPGASDSQGRPVFTTRPWVIPRPTQVSRPPSGSSGFSPCWKGPLCLRDGAGLSGCRVTLGLDVPLHAAGLTLPLETLAGQSQVGS